MTLTLQEALKLAVEVFLLAGVLATIVERVTQLLFKPIHPIVEKYAQYIAALLGITVALVFKIDFISLVTDAVTGAASVQFAGTILSGILIGGGSNFLHDIWPVGR